MSESIYSNGTYSNWPEGIVLLNKNTQIAKNLTIAYNTTICDTTDSISTSTGGLVIKGGLGIEKNITVGGNINITDKLVVSDKIGIGTTTPTELLDVNGNIKLSGDIKLADNKKLILGTDSDYNLQIDTSETSIALETSNTSDVHFHIRTNSGLTNTSKWSHYIPHTSGTYGIWNKISGSWVEYLRITPHASGASSGTITTTANIKASTIELTGSNPSVYKLGSGGTTSTNAWTWNNIIKCDVPTTGANNTSNHQVGIQMGVYGHTTSGDSNNYGIQFSGYGGNRMATIESRGPTTGGIAAVAIYYVQGSFTGQHRCVANTTIDISQHKGMICSSTGEYNTYDYYNEVVLTDNNGITLVDSLPVVRLSKTRQEKSVFGVICDVADSDLRHGAFVTPLPNTNDNARIFINSIGEGGIWVVNTNGNLENGDYIQSSDVEGFGEKQTSEFLANYTVAKITCDCAFDINSTKYNCVEFVDTASGNTYKKAFVGCTYHCG